MAPEPAPEVVERAARLTGWTPTAWRPVTGGYTPAARYVASAGRKRAFVKVATTPLTARHLRREGFVYERLSGRFMPGFIGWQDHEQAPILVIEDLSGAGWPPPWSPRALDAVLDEIAAVHSGEAALRPFSDVHGAPASGWAMLAAAPDPFLSLGLTSSEWLARALPALLEAEAACPTEGLSVCHFDLRSDNICLVAAEPKFIDWAAASQGNPQLDLGFWLPSLCFEGGPPPDELLADAAAVAAYVSGYFAARAGLPTIADAPFVRRVQREQLSTALPWAIRALKLPDL